MKTFSFSVVYMSASSRVGKAFTKPLEFSRGHCGGCEDAPRRSRRARDSGIVGHLGAIVGRLDVIWRLFCCEVLVSLVLEV